MTKEELLALIEQNPGVKCITIDEVNDYVDPDWEKEKLEIRKKYFRPECFPPELKHLRDKFEDILWRE